MLIDTVRNYSFDSLNKGGHRSETELDGLNYAINVVNEEGKLQVLRQRLIDLLDKLMKQ